MTGVNGVPAHRRRLVFVGSCIAFSILIAGGFATANAPSESESESESAAEAEETPELGCEPELSERHDQNREMCWLNSGGHICDASAGANCDEEANLDRRALVECYVSVASEYREALMDCPPPEWLNPKTESRKGAS